MRACIAEGGLCVIRISMGQCDAHQKAVGDGRTDDFRCAGIDMEVSAKEVRNIVLGSEAQYGFGDK